MAHTNKNEQARNRRDCEAAETKTDRETKNE